MFAARAEVSFRYFGAEGEGSSFRLIPSPPHRPSARHLRDSGHSLELGLERAAVLPQWSETRTGSAVQQRQRTTWSNMPSQSLQLLLVAVTFAFAGLLVLSAGVFTVEQRTVSIVQRLRRFLREAGPGPHVKIPFADRVVGRRADEETPMSIHVGTTMASGDFVAAIFDEAPATAPNRGRCHAWPRGRCGTRSGVLGRHPRHRLEFVVFSGRAAHENPSTA